MECLSLANKGMASAFDGEQVGHAGGAPHLVTASLDGTIAVCGATGKGGGRADGILQRLQVCEG